MYDVVKSAIIGWWVGFLVALMLWYRGKNYDRALGIIIFIYGLISLINYGIYNNSNSGESGAAIAALIGLAAFIPLLTLLSVKSHSVIAGLFLAILIAIIFLAIFYTLEYSSEYDLAKGRIVYQSHNGLNSFIGAGWLVVLAAAAIIGLIMLYLFVKNDHSDILRLTLFAIAVLSLLYIGYNSYLIPKIYYMVVIIAALALLL
jgi:hypothetical protein